MKLEENEYYVADLIGSTVISDETDELGHLTEVIKTGANDVYVVTTNDYKELVYEQLPTIKKETMIMLVFISFPAKSVLKETFYLFLVIFNII